MNTYLIISPIPGHRIRECRSTKTCIKCDKKHHTSIHMHQSRPAGDSEVVEEVVAHVTTTRCFNTLVADNEGEGFANTCVIIAKANGHKRTARVYCDSGSSKTYFTSSLIQSLGAKCELRKTRITGMDGIEVARSNRRTTKQMQSIAYPEKTPLTVRGIVVDRIMGPTPRAVLPITPRSSLFQDKVLADPCFHLPGKIDIMIGNDLLIKAKVLEQERSEDKEVLAKNTMFGWMVSGSWEDPTQREETRCLRTSVADTRTDEILQRFWESEEPPPDIGELSMADQAAMDS